MLYSENQGEEFPDWLKPHIRPMDNCLAFTLTTASQPLYLLKMANAISSLNP